MSSTTTTYAHQTKAEFLQEGFELTILESPNSGEEEDCSICTRPIYRGLHPSSEPAEPGLRIKACGHELGATCAQKWFTEKNSCPFCRAALFPLQPMVKVAEITWVDTSLVNLNVVYNTEGARAAEAFYEVHLSEEESAVIEAFHQAQRELEEEWQRELQEERERELQEWEEQEEMEWEGQSSDPGWW